MGLRPAILLLTVLVAGGVRGAEPPKYEVASIKANTDGGLGYRFYIGPDGSLAASGITLRRLMMTAYNVQGFRIAGGPEWVGSSRWQVQAKPDRAASPDQVRPMLRALIEERFQLRTRSEKRQLPVYELVVDRKGSKVAAVKDRDAEPTVRIGNGLIQLTNAMSATFASQLSYALGQPVVDKTGLAGKFDFALEWTPEPGEDGGPETSGLPPGTRQEPPSSTDEPSIFTAIREQLGLRLKSGRGAVEVIVIDDVRTPAAN